MFFDKRRSHLCHFGDDDIWIGKYRFNAVHLIPERICLGDEFDFYIDDGKQIFLLYMRCSTRNQLSLFPMGKDGVIPIVLEKEFFNSIFQELEQITKFLSLKLRTMKKRKKSIIVPF